MVHSDRSMPNVVGHVTLLLSVALVVVVSWALVVRSPDGPVGPSGATDGPSASRTFFDRYVDTDGRVVRHDQGGDTVSEGQADALRLAVGDGDADGFDRVWSWTRDHLQVSSGLLAWQWANGAVVDAEPVTDADVDVAVALAQASTRFHRDDYGEEARRIAAAVLDHETVDVAGRLTLVAGPWAVAERVVNPSYLAPCDAEDLATFSDDDRWLRVRDTAAVLLGEQIATGLPADWAILDASGRLQPIARPEDRTNPARYGLDAARVPARLWGCEAGRDLAAPLWARLEHLPADGAYSAYALDGAPLDPRPHPIGLIAGALAAGTAGDRARSEELIGLAARLDQAQPSFYGAAWLGRAEQLLATISIEIPAAGDSPSSEVAATPSSIAAAPPPTDAPLWWPATPPDATLPEPSLWVSAVLPSPPPAGPPAPASPHPPNLPPTVPPTPTTPTSPPPTTVPPTTSPPPTTPPPTTEPPTTPPLTIQPPISTVPPGLARSVRSA